jgi:hypothetical protein
MDCDNGVIIYRSEHRDETGDMHGASRVLIAPWCTRIKPQHGTGKLPGQGERPRSEIVFGWRLEWRTAFVPNLGGSFDADQVILGALAILTFAIDGVEVPLVDVTRWDCPLLVAVVAGLPVGKAEPLADVIAAHLPVVAAM